MVQVVAVTATDREISIIHEDGNQFSCEPIFYLQFGFPPYTSIQSNTKFGIFEVGVLCIFP